jgi:hypothetical protein
MSKLLPPSGLFHKIFSTSLSHAGFALSTLAGQFHFKTSVDESLFEHHPFLTSSRHAFSHQNILHRGHAFCPYNSTDLMSPTCIRR